MGEDLLRKWAVSADILVAADGASDQLLEIGLIPNAIVGDLDSISHRALSCGAELYKDSSQSTTDCDKLLAFCATRNFSPLTLASLEGDRLDHVLDSLFSIGRSKVRQDVTVALRRGLAWVVGPEGISRDAEPGQTASLIPLTDCLKVRAEGVRWPLRSADLSPSRLTSISNQVVSNRIEVKLKSGLLLLLIEHDVSEFPIW